MSTPNKFPNWENWVVDVTFGAPYAFCPIEDDGRIVFGMNMIQDRSPGNLVGVLHSEGQAAVEQWCEENPDWHTALGPAPSTNKQP